MAAEDVPKVIQAIRDPAQPDQGLCLEPDHPGWGHRLLYVDNNGNLPALDLYIKIKNYHAGFKEALEEIHRELRSPIAQTGPEDPAIEGNRWSRLFQDSPIEDAVPYKANIWEQLKDKGDYSFEVVAQAAFNVGLMSFHRATAGRTTDTVVGTVAGQGSILGSSARFGNNMGAPVFQGNRPLGDRSAPIEDSVIEASERSFLDTNRWDDLLLKGNGFLDSLEAILELADNSSDLMSNEAVCKGDCARDLQSGGAQVSRFTHHGTMVDIPAMQHPERAAKGVGPRSRFDAVSISEIGACPKTARELAEEYYEKFIHEITRIVASEIVEERDQNRRAESGGNSNLAEDHAAAMADAANQALIANAAAEAALGIFQTAPYREQCYLLSQLFNLTEYKRQIDGKIGKRLPYLPFYSRIISNWEPAPGETDPVLGYDGNAHIALDGETFGFLNLLTQDPKLRHLWGVSPNQLSALQPMIRLFKLQTSEDENGNALETEQEFNFDSHLTTNDILLFQTKEKRGMGAGIQSFNFTYDGHNPFAAKKSIKAELKIFANDFEELLRDRGGYRYIDLALKTGNTLKSTPLRQNGENECDPTGETSNAIDPGNDAAYEDELDKLRFRLKAVVGWASPNLNNTSTFAHQKRWKNTETNAPSAGYFEQTTPGGSQPPLIDAVDASFVTLNLTPTIHNYEIDDQGRVTFTINYLAYVEDFFDSPTFNIFTDLNIGERSLMRKLQFQKLNTACAEEDAEEFKEKTIDEIKKDKLESLSILLGKLFDQKKVYFSDMSYDELKTWRRRGPWAPNANARRRVYSPASRDATSRQRDVLRDIRRTANNANSQERSAEETSRYLSSVANDMNKNSLPFFYVGDLIDIILEGIEDYLSKMPEQIGSIEESRLPSFVTKCDLDFEIHKIQKFKEQFTQFRVVLGPAEIVNPAASGQSKEVNFALFPISVKYFMEWLTNQLLKKERIVYTLPNFLNDFFNLLVRNFLNDDTCFKTPIKQKIRNTQTILSDYSTDEIDTLSADYLYFKARRQAYREENPSAYMREYEPLYISKDTYSAESRPVLNISGPSPKRPVSLEPKDNFNYLVYFAGRVQPTEHMNGDFMEDSENGIFHFQAGLSHGMVKNIGLTKTTSPGLPEVRFEQDGYDGLRQLRETFDAEIKTYALPQTFPGCYIYIDPRGWTPGSTRYISDGNKTYDITEFGIGGYYMVIRSTTGFAAGKAETTITAKWVANLERADDTERDTGDGSTASTNNQDAPTKCTTRTGWQPIPASSVTTSDPPPLESADAAGASVANQLGGAILD